MEQMVTISQLEYEDFLKFKKIKHNDFTIDEELNFSENTREAQNRIDHGEFVAVDGSNVGVFLNSLRSKNE